MTNCFPLSGNSQPSTAGSAATSLNQIARYLNEYGAPYNALSGEIRAAIADLAALKYEVLQKVGDAVGNTQAYQL